MEDGFARDCAIAIGWEVKAQEDITVSRYRWNSCGFSKIGYLVKWRMLYFVCVCLCFFVVENVVKMWLK